MTFRHMITPEQRRRKLKQLLQSKGFVRVIEAHNGLSALVATNASVTMPGEAEPRIFDAIWESSLTDSASKGQPDIEVVSFDSRLQTIQQIANVSDKPIIVDGDTGGDANHFEYFVAKLESLGVSAVIIEDKVFPKRNSLDADAKQDLENPDLFATKITRGKKVLLTQDFMIIARLESLIAGFGVEDALMRAKKYLAAGVDGIMIHSKDKDPRQLFRFVEEYNKLFCDSGSRKPLVAVPTTYNHTTESELKQRGINMVIHANHLLRSSYKAMQNVASTILAHQRSLEVDPVCASVKSVFDVVGFLDVKEKDKQYAPKYTGLRAIIPAAGQSRVFQDTPKPLLDINGKTILERMRETFHKAGVKEVSVIRGFKKDLFTVPKIKYHDNDAYAQTHILDSLFRAQEDMENGFIYAYADLLFNESIIKSLMDTDGDIVLVVDNTYTHHKHTIDKELDLVTTHTTTGALRDINPTQHMHIAKIGKRLSMDHATHEFVGIAKFSKEGAAIVRQIYDECKQNPTMLFHEAPIFSRASFTDIIQEIINRGHKVHVMEVNRGWIEIHQPKDIEIAKTMVV
jgi:phosphoenolpyruvate phosphomutase